VSAVFDDRLADLDSDLNTSEGGAPPMLLRTVALPANIRTMFIESETEILELVHAQMMIAAKFKFSENYECGQFRIMGHRCNSASTSMDPLHLHECTVCERTFANLANPERHLISDVHFSIFFAGARLDDLDGDCSFTYTHVQRS